MSICTYNRIDVLFLKGLCTLTIISKTMMNPAIHGKNNQHQVIAKSLWMGSALSQAVCALIFKVSNGAM